jgi:hypothetical protein
MDGDVSVDEAISRGRKMITYPMIAIFVAVPALALYMCDKHGYPQWTIGLGLLVGALLAITYSFFVVNKWRIWAFTNVQNVHELRARAIRGNLMYDDEGFIGFLMLRWSKGGKEIMALEAKFLKKDIQDDVLLPPETIVYISKGAGIVVFAFFLCLAGLGIVCFLTGSIFGGVLFTGLGGFLSYRSYMGLKDAINKVPQIILSYKGMQTETAPFHEWKDIKGEDILKETSGYGTNRSEAFFLVYDYPGGHEKYEVAALTVNYEHLISLMKAYRFRYEQKHRQQMPD